VQIDVQGQLKTGPVSHQLSAGFERVVDYFHVDNYARDPAATPRAHTLDFFDSPYRQPVPANAPLGIFVETPTPLHTSFNKSKSTNNGWWGAYRAGFIGDRLLVTGSMRHETYETTSRETFFNTAGAIARVAPGAGVDGDATTGSFGALLHVNDTFSIYGAYMESFFPVTGSGTERVDGAIVRTFPLKPRSGEGVDLGVKFQSRNGGFSGYVAWWHIESDGRALTRNLGPNHDLTVQVTGQTSEGVETTFVVTPTANLQSIASYTYIDMRNARDFVRFDLGGRTDVRGIPRHAASLWNKYLFTTER